jgi:hypothetical protein
MQQRPWLYGIMVDRVVCPTTIHYNCTFYKAITMISQQRILYTNILEIINLKSVQYEVEFHAHMSVAAHMFGISVDDCRTFSVADTPRIFFWEVANIGCHHMTPFVNGKLSSLKFLLKISCHI